jgi:hypothetical protein
LQLFAFVFGDENALHSRNLSEKAVTMDSTKSIKIRMPEQSNLDYRVVTFGSGGVGKSSLGEEFFNFDFRSLPSSEKMKRRKKFLVPCLSAHVRGKSEQKNLGGRQLFGAENVFLDFRFASFLAPKSPTHEEHFTNRCQMNVLFITLIPRRLSCFAFLC